MVQRVYLLNVVIASTLVLRSRNTRSRDRACTGLHRFLVQLEDEGLCVWFRCLAATYGRLQPAALHGRPYLDLAIALPRPGG